jgi:hypothetical protein
MEAALLPGARMPYKHKEPSCRTIPEAKYQIQNSNRWEYAQAPQQLTSAPARLAAVFLMKLLARPNDLGMIWNVELAGWPHIDVAIWVLAASFMFALGA